MITSEVRIFDHFARIDAAIEEKTRRALNAAARRGQAVANEKAGNVGPFDIKPAHPIFQGFASGIRGRNPLWRIFDHGSLGKRRRGLKRDRRKSSWTVHREVGGVGHVQEYEAHRQDVSGKGITPRDISNPARRAGRKELIARLSD